MKLLIKNGTVVNPLAHKTVKASILIENGVISKISQNDDIECDGKVIDAEGLIVAPGFIDIHVHFRDPGFEHKEDILTGLESAAAGGYTSVCTMPNTNPVADSVDTLNYMKKKALLGNGVKLYPVSAATVGLKGEVIVPLKDLKEAGAVAFSDDGKPVVDAAILRKAMETGSSLGMKYISHSEDIYLAKGGHMNEGLTSFLLGFPGIPVVAESCAIARDCMLAQYLDVPLHIAHVSSQMSVDIIKYFKEKGVEVTAETAPHYLLLTDKAVADFGANAKMNPPLREETDRLALIEAVKKGVIDCISTDHAPHHENEKNVEFTSAPFGIIGLETALSVVLKLYHQGIFTIEKVVELFINGYSVMGIRGGMIEEGGVADITIFNPDEVWTVDTKMFKSKSGNSPFNGMEVKGAVTHTIVEGSVVYSRYN